MKFNGSFVNWPSCPYLRLGAKRCRHRLTIPMQVYLDGSSSVFRKLFYMIALTTGHIKSHLTKPIDKIKSAVILKSNLCM